MDLFDALKYSSHGGKKRKSSLDNKVKSSTNNFDSSKKHVGKSKNESLKKEKNVNNEHSTLKKEKKVNNEHSTLKKEKKVNNDHSTKKSGDKKVENKSKNHEQKLAKFNAKHKSHHSTSRRESMPSPVSHAVLSNKKKKKSRSLSPPKYIGNAVIKSLKIKLERKKLEDFLKSPLVAKSNNAKSKQDKHKEAKAPNQKEAKVPNQKSPVKATPTKAQKKLFEPIKAKKSRQQILKEFNIKKCAVRIRRDNLKKLKLEFNKSRINKSKSNSKQASAKTLPKSRKRLALSDDDGSPPPKKGKTSPPKGKMNFFIKITPHKIEKKSKISPRISSSSSSVAHHNKIKNSKSIGITTPTKFTRSHLIRTFGKRYFSSFVRIEKCHHPLLLTFESNDRARRLQAKRNKSKNLSVSFREQVEVFGNSSDSENSCDEDFCAIPPTNQKGGRRSGSSNVALAIASAKPVVMPARLKKVENGKVVDDIELDPSLFLDPKNMITSSPYTPGRKKRDHKSFSPLKDEGTPSPRKEQLKLANEKIPPSGLRRLNIEDDDEDDDCEYIVPIELPQRRTSSSSRTSSTNTLDGGPTFTPPAPPASKSVSCSKAQNKKIENGTKKTVNSKKAAPASKGTISPQKGVVASTPIVSTPSAIANVNTSPIPTSEAEPKAAEPKTAEPETAEPVASEPETAEPVAAEPEDAEPEAAEPEAAEPEAAEPETAELETSDPEIAEPEDNPETNDETTEIPEIPICDTSTEAETENAEPQKNACNEETESHDSFHSANNDNDLQQKANGSNSKIANRSTSLSPTSVLDDVLDLDASAVDAVCETKQAHDILELNSSSEKTYTEDKSEFDSACQMKDKRDTYELDLCETNDKQNNSELDSACKTKDKEDNSELDAACETKDKSELDLAFDLACEAKDSQDESELVSACEVKQTQDMPQLNGTGMSTMNDDISLNLFLEDDSQADDDGPERSFVDSIINETIDKLSKDIEEGSPVDEQPSHTT